MVEHVQGVVKRTTSNPRTILAFWGVALSVIVSGTVGTVGFLASSESRYLVLPTLIFGGTLIVAIIVGLFVLCIVKPQRLMLGQISGTEYVAIEQRIYGDSDNGEFVGGLAVAPIPAGTRTENTIGEVEEEEEEEE